MATVLHTLTDVELLRRARTSQLMDCPLFAEIMDRFESDTTHENLRELAAQQRQHTNVLPFEVKKGSF